MKKEKTQSNGLMLGKRGVVAPESSALFSVCFNVFILLFAAVAAEACFFTALEIEIYPLPILLASAACAVLCAVRSKLHRAKLPLLLIITAVWLIVLYANFKAAEYGCLRTLNAVITAYSDKFSYPLNTFVLTFVNAKRACRQNTLFAALLQLPFLQLLSWLLLTHKSALGAFCLTGMFLLVPLAVSIVPAAWAMGLLLAFWAFLLFSAAALRCQAEDTASPLSESFFARPASLALLAVLLLCVAGLYKAFPPETYERPTQANELRAMLTDGTLPALVSGGAGGYDSVDLNQLKDREYSGETVLQVRHEVKNGDASAMPKLDYLKSFVGSVYTGSSWEQLPEAAAKEVDSLFADLTPQTLPAELSLAYYSDFDMHTSYLLHINNVSADRFAIYSPYGLYADTLADGMAFSDDSFLGASGIRPMQREYTFSAVAVPETGVTMGERFARIMSLQCPDEAAELFDEEYESFLYENVSVPSAAALWHVPNWAKQALDGTDFSLLEATEAYSGFVYEQYIQLPESTRSFLDSFLSGYDFPAPAATESLSGYQNAVFSALKELLSSTCSYTLTPQAVPKSSDFTEYFLTKSREGYCVHFATAAVAVLRYLGIPARYAEGYAVPVNRNGSWVNVPDYYAHAWAEVYYSGIGWLPLEVTPAAAANSRVPENAIAHGPEPTSTATAAPTTAPTATSQPAPTPEAAASSELPVETDSPSTPPTEKSDKPAVKYCGTADNAFNFLPLGFFAVLLAAVIYGQRRLRVQLRRKSFEQRDINRAALSLYKHLLRLYRAAAWLKNAETEPPAEINELALKARFSRNGLNKTEFEKLSVAVAALESKLKVELSWCARIRCEYILALF